MKLLTGMIFVAISFVFVATASAKPEDSSRQVTKLKDVDIVSMVNDVALPIHVSMEIQKDNHGYAVTEAKTLNTRGETTYQLRVSRDTSNSPGGKYIMYDEDWKVVSEMSVLQQDSSPRPSTENKDDDDEEEDDATNQEASEATIRSTDRPKPDEDGDNEDAPGEVEPDNDATDDDADDKEDDEAVNQPDTATEDPG